MLNVALPKIDGVSDQPAIEMNSVFNEMQNTILSTGQALSGADLFQTGKSMAAYAGVADFYVDTGAANAYVLGSIGLLESPPAYYDGMRIRFDATNTNSGASTVNVAGLGVKNILDVRGNPLQGGELIVGYRNECIYNGTNFLLIDQGFGSVANVASITSPGSQSLTVFPTVVKVDFDTVQFDTFNIYNVGATRIQPAIPGLYRINIAVGITYTPAAVGQFACQIYKNGAPYLTLFEIATVYAVATLDESNSSSIFINVSAGDYFEFYLSQSTGATATINASLLEVEYIGQI